MATRNRRAKRKRSRLGKRELERRALEHLVREKYEKVTLPEELSACRESHLELFEFDELPCLLQEDEEELRREFEKSLPTKIREFREAASREDYVAEMVEDTIRELEAKLAAEAAG